ncbi:hypothetical protein HBI56_154360 [Parastagonospora nodorum]|uniref:Zn(2)-C6 fungal-type domain-containing protein n=2 Tax=Phaeosphaeria nodorum (strain SN15 / ATCC MYA-4574 / FGSC 10173) TaxID=321614 RepID=A0A7U2I8G6_PHANO|nr:hypothetical protein HBH56_117030 [Parastagonospora nodorum]QRD05167.1 hypothetical protein JI435_110790 [Parastagonospora nodorum SN15]KAH3929136.1 hypothetical protein HBH54_132170 [Parastagonospora nodorum]KAH3965884.1 hypothetical protein HBH51_149320 [Parastagonospora nodorum]KAH3973754.1 hypothetical protein HBH52_139350 [Parastagonospora nodorum]
MPPPSGIRLRDSCQACAISKTKCSKDKPQCTRCAKRNTPCQYLVTQRTGRKAVSRSDSKDETTPIASLSPTTTPEQPAILSPLERRQSGPDFSMLNSRLDALEAAMLPASTDACFSMLLTDLDFSTPVQSYNTAVDSDIPHAYTLGTSHGGSHEMTYESCHAGLHAGHSLSSHDLCAQDGTQATFASAPLPNEQLFQELGNSQIFTLSQQQEGIKTALQLMGTLCCPEDHPPYASLSPLEREISATTLMDRCRKVTRTVSDMLQSDSSKDGYFLAVVCLLMSKVLDAYVCASQALSIPEVDELRMSLSSSSSTAASESSRSSVSLAAGGGDQKAVQQLLDELYQVRASMDLLGAKIISMSSSRDGMAGGSLTPSYYETLAATLPFSAEILNQLYNEQRRRLKTVSLQLINNLRAFWVEEHVF